MYKPGEVQQVKSKQDRYELGVPIGTFYLYHSCDNWVIGETPQVLQLVHDLESMLGILKCTTTCVYCAAVIKQEKIGYEDNESA